MRGKQEKLEAQIRAVGRRARAAGPMAAALGTPAKNEILREMAARLRREQDSILKANEKDLKAGAKLSAALIDRLRLTPERIEAMAAGLEEVAALPDPVGQIVKSWERPNGLQVARVRIPLGVIGIVYESRPNVTVDAAGLCLKSGNVVILRGGSEALHSNKKLSDLLRGVLKERKLSPDLIQFVNTTDRAAMKFLVRLTEFIDLIIPRGGEGLMKWMVEHSRVPIIKHDKGVCHVYVDAAANLDKATEITFNSKAQRTGVCNAAETLLVHEAIAPRFLPRMATLFARAQVELRGDPVARKLVPSMKRATAADWPTEYLDKILAVKVVRSLDEAIAHIRRYGSLHTESIVTEDTHAAERFVRELDSSVLMVNASTRFNDGGQLGLGAEIGISTSKLHAFGPMGLEELTTTKFVVHGNGQIRT